MTKLERKLQGLTKQLETLKTYEMLCMFAADVIDEMALNAIKNNDREFAIKITQEKYKIMPDTRFGLTEHFMRHHEESHDCGLHGETKD